MIRINITDKSEYLRLRKKYLKKISKYVYFDEEDIVPDLENKVKKKKEEKLKNNTKDTAKKLKRNFPKLYEYLFQNNSDKVDREKLRYLLAGPDEMPKSFGGCGEEQTMLESLDKIILACQIKNADDKEAARECCEQIFNYDKFVKGQKEAYWLLRNLDVRVCPYCNRIYTVTLPSPEELEEGEEFKATRATFDHFYNKAEYPYLSLSLFNLVPSCYTCNLNKINSDKAIIYPYDQEFGKDAVFRIIPNLSKAMCKKNDNLLDYLHGKGDQFYIKLMCKEEEHLWRGISLKDRFSAIDNEDLRKRIIASIETFKLEELYKEHNKEIQDILRKRYYFSNQYIKTQICPLIREKMGQMINEEDVEKEALNMLFFSKIRLDEWGQRPLSKLVSDILDQFSDL